MMFRLKEMEIVAGLNHYIYFFFPSSEAGILFSERVGGQSFGQFVSIHQMVYVYTYRCFIVYISHHLSWPCNRCEE